MKTIYLLMIIIFFVHPVSKATAIHSCNADVTIPENGTTIDLTTGVRGHRYTKIGLEKQSVTGVIDTGGMGVGGLITENYLEKINLNNQSMQEIESHGAHSSGKNKTFTMPSISIGDATVDNLMFVVTKELITKDNKPILIGSRFLCQFLLSWNFQENTMSLYDRETDIKKLLENKEQWISSSFENFYGTGGIIFPMQVNGKTIKAALDTGSPYIGLNWKAAKLAGIDKNSDKIRKFQDKSGGMHGEKIMTLNEASFQFNVQSKNAKPTEYKAMINDMHAYTQIFGENPGIILGLPFFEGKQIIIDYVKNKIYISKV